MAFLASAVVFAGQAGRVVGLDGVAQAQAPTAASAIGAAAPKAMITADPADADNIVFERQQAMLQLEKDADAMGSIVAGEVPPARMAEVARAIAQDARDSYEAFRPNVPGGRAKPDIWANWPEYSQRMESFVQNTEALSKAADTGNLTTVTSLLGDALPCKQCHDVYRKPKTN